MDTDTAHAIDGLVKMIDHVNRTTEPKGLGLTLSLTALCALRRNGLLNEAETQIVEQSFANAEEQISQTPYEKTSEFLSVARKMWELSRT